jgi:magnesium chelatase accessory protein
MNVDTVQPADRQRWAREGRDWPNSQASRFVRAGGLTFHVQVIGSGPVLLLLHGTGASTHSWRDVMPLLAEAFTVVAADLPGHGFSEAPPARLLSLPGMARSLAALTQALGLPPVLAAGHSAGAAILARMCLDGGIAPRGLLSFNGALLPLEGMPGHLFAPLARLLVGLPGVPELVAWRAGNPAIVDRLLTATGSKLDPAGADYYRRLVRNPRHAAGALGMMANWDLRPLLRDLPRLKPALTVVVATNDRTIAPADGQRLARLVPGARLVEMPGLGHLSHEEQPEQAATLIRDAARDLGLPSGG